jgi:hypothetical protein
MDLSNCRCGDGSLFFVIIVDLPYVCSVVWRRGSHAVAVGRKEKRVRMRCGVTVLVC